MNGLYKRVLKGAYPEIPKKYTRDLADVIMRMLSVDPRQRPTCVQLLDLDPVLKRHRKLFPNDFDETIEEEEAYNMEGDVTFELLNTIRVP